MRISDWSSDVCSSDLSRDIRPDNSSMTDAMTPALARIAALACWSGPVDPEPLAGGITNANFVVRHRGERFFVRVGDDIPVHGIMRFNELAASRAAVAAGLSPEVVHAEPGALVFQIGRAHV